MLMSDVFVNASMYVPVTDTLLDALQYPGGDDLIGGAQILLRNAVAGVLNAQSSVCELSGVRRGSHC
jgi:hypothetical protein